MKKLELYAGQDLAQALLTLKLEAKARKEDCFAVFNGEKIYSTDTLDEAYKKIVGCTYEEFLAKIEEWKRERERKKKEFKEKIPEYTESYRSEARGIIAEKDLEHWDEIVPIRLSDLYHGWELRCTLDIVKIMNNEKEALESRIAKAKAEFVKQDHSGMSASLMFAMLRAFCPNGENLVNELK